MPKLEMWSSSLTPFWMAGQPSAHDIPLGKEQCLWKTGDATHYPYFVDVAIRWSAFLSVLKGRLLAHDKLLTGYSGFKV